MILKALKGIGWLTLYLVTLPVFAITQRFKRRAVRGG